MTNKFSSDNEIPKYRKQKESSTSKSQAKSRHKHEYKDCLIQYSFSFMGKDAIHTHLGSYCTVCGKIGDSLVKKENSIIELQDLKLRNDDLYEKYGNKLPVFWTNGFGDKYVDLEQNKKDASDFEEEFDYE